MCTGEKNIPTRVSLSVSGTTLSANEWKRDGGELHGTTTAAAAATRQHNNDDDDKSYGALK